MEIELKLEGSELFSAQLELLIKILAIQKATVSIVCDKLSKSEIESDALYRSVMDEGTVYGQQILKDLYGRRGKIDISDFLDRK